MIVFHEIAEESFPQAVSLVLHMHKSIRWKEWSVGQSWKMK
jgi:hypothetical protein